MAVVASATGCPSSLSAHSPELSPVPAKSNLSDGIPSRANRLEMLVHTPLRWAEKLKDPLCTRSTPRSVGELTGDVKTANSVSVPDWRYRAVSRNLPVDATCAGMLIRRSPTNSAASRERPL